MTRREQWGAYGAWAAVCFFWGTTYLAIRVGLESLPPLLFAGLRFLVAGGVLLFLMSRQRNLRLPTGREWRDLAVVGLLLLGVGNGMVVVAEQWVSSGMAALLVATSPFWVAGLERLQRGGERVGARGLVGMLVGFGGLALLVGPQLKGTALSGHFLLGVVGIQVGCVAWTAGSVYAKRRPVGVAPLVAAAVQMLYAGAALAVLGTLGGEWSALRFSPRSAAALCYLIVFGSIVAYGSYTYAMQKLPLSLVTTYSYVNPVIAMLLGWLVLGEPLGWRVLTGACVILCGVVLVKSSPGEMLALARRLKRARGRARADEVTGEETAARQATCEQT